MKNQFWQWVHRLRYLGPLAILCVSLLSFPSASQLRTDPTNQALFEANQDWVQQIQFEHSFGKGENLVIGLEAPDVFAAESVQWMDDLAKFLEVQPGIQSVQNVARLKGLKRKLFRLETTPLSQNYLEGKAEKADFIRQVAEAREISDHLVSSEHDFAITIAELGSSANRKEMVTGLQSWLHRHPPKGGKIYFSGSALEQSVFETLIQKDHRLFVPLTFAVILLATAIFQGNALAVVFPAFTIAATVVITEAIMVWTGHALNVITTLVSPVIIIVSVSDAIHYQGFIHHEEHRLSGADRLGALFKTLGKPCLMTSLTTMAGFFSLVTMPIPAIRMFGFYAGLGTLLAYVFTVLLVPFFTSFHFFHPAVRKHERRSHPIVAFWEVLLRTGKGRLRWLSLVLLVIGGVGVTQVKSETNILKSFFDREPFRIATEKIQDRIGGVYALEIRIQTPDNLAFYQPQHLAALRRIRQDIETIPGVKRVHAITDLLSFIDRAVRGSGSDAAIPETYLKRYLDGLDEDNSPELGRLRTQHFRQTRMTVDLSDSSTRQTLRVARDIEQVFKQHLPAQWTFAFAGQTYLLAKMSEVLVRNQMLSTGVSLGVITFMMMLSLRSFRLGLLSAYVNLVPLALIGLAMMILHIHLNTATAMVVSVAFGLIIDNAIHVLFHYQRLSKHDQEVLLSHWMRSCAVPLTQSTLVLCLGFAVTLFGSVQPTQHFGILMVMVLILSLATNLLFLPSFLLTREAPKKGAG